MRTFYKVISPKGGEPEIHETDIDEQPSYKVLQRIVEPHLDGAFLERVKVLADFNDGSDLEPLDMFVDETGMLKGLPINPVATDHYQRATLTNAPNIDRRSLPSIYGPAVLFSRVVWF